MLKMIKLVGLAVAALLAVLLFNTFRYAPEPYAPEEAALPALNELAIAAKLSQAIQFKTISHPLGAPNRSEDFQGFLDRLDVAFPNATAAMDQTLVSVFTPVFRWPGRETNSKPILISTHYDVVPGESDWSRDPWAGEIADGYVWGRGAIDMKSGVITLLEALDMLVEEDFQPQRDIYVTITQDEEIGGKGGAQAVAAFMQDNNIEIDWTLDEGSFVLRDIIGAVEIDLAIINEAEIGFMTLRITASANGGHSSMPQAATAISRLAEAITDLQSNPIPGGLSGLSEDMFTGLGPNMGFAERVLFANMWLTRPLLERILSATNTTNAVLRTTTAATMLTGAKAENVLPQAASVVVNFRLHPRDSVETVLRHVEELLPQDHFEFEVLNARAASPVGNHENSVFSHLKTTTQQVFGDVVVLPGLTVGGTDSAHNAGLTNDSYRFLPFVATSEDVGLLHAKDERISVENLKRATEFYYLFLKGL